jgi:hypothetical protein
MNLVRLFALCIVAAFLSACRPVLALPTPTTSAPETNASGPKSGQPLWTLTYSRSGGFAGISESVKIESGGLVLDSQEQKISAPADEVSALTAEISQLDFSSFDEAYGNSADCRDCFTYQLTFEQGGKAKTITWVEDGTTELPKELQSVLQKLTELASVN